MRGLSQDSCAPRANGEARSGGPSRGRCRLAPNRYRFLVEQNYLMGNPWHGIHVPRARLGQNGMWAGS